MWAVWTLFESNWKKEWTCLLQQVLRRLFEAEQKKTPTKSISFLLQSSAINLPYNRYKSFVSQKLCRSLYQHNFFDKLRFLPFFRFDLSPETAFSVHFFLLDAFLSRSGLFSSFSFLIALSSLSIIYVYSLFLSFYLYLFLILILILILLQSAPLSSKCTVVFLTQFVFILAQVISWVYDLFMVYVWFLFIQAINVDECKNLTEFCWIESKYSVWWHQFVVYYVDYWASVFVKKKNGSFR